MKINEIIRKVRLDLMETQKEFGNRFDLTAPAISYYEKGERKGMYNKVVNFCLNYYEKNIKSLDKE